MQPSLTQRPSFRGKSIVIVLEEKNDLRYNSEYPPISSPLVFRICSIFYQSIEYN